MSVGCLGAALAAWLSDSFRAPSWMAAQGPLASLAVGQDSARSSQLGQKEADAQRRADRRCAALSRSVQRPKGARSSAMLNMVCREVMGN